ncbi:hypothetical protein LWT83_07760 [Enterobacter hormaechei]|uniref:hypothetical protein n=1 Tax=Enterobacter cloacae complex TaxID=354276 RepID=UPI000F81F5C0|nr:MULTISPECIES: hypothetical protein [Enterobacter cloacae complex]MCC4567831.1 hypothetical protein [Enterobacter hormaechei subsp. hoffmannii]MCC4576060.1 hypothetical protein [Enterobacter hormaechei subsp. hoffmannii]MCC4580605.1 hypothetical protein [Enterobacter hormaechei subsp. hoffmannii]MCC4581468.1 hypothetical protein [Enterobacter hormaechei subsp. hoffmannii]MCE1614368.1 hypothetical protein [Enterobacter hormaechei]
MSGGLIVNTSTIRNTVEFVVDRNSMKEAMDAFDQIQKKAKGIKDPTLNMKKFSQGLKSAERELDRLNKKASKPRDNSQREAERAAKAKARAEAQAAKEAARNAQRRERAELKLLDTASSFKSMQHLTNVELTQAALAASRITKAYAAGTISLQRQNSEIKRLQQSYRRINAERRAAAKAGGANVLGGGGKATGAISGSLMGLGTGALAGAGIGAAAYGAYSWGKEAVTAQEERSEIVQRAKLGGVDYNVLQALSQYATANGIDSGMGIQGQRKLLDSGKDVSEKLADSYTNSTFDKKSGQWKGGNAAVDTALNMGFTKEDLKSYQSNPFGFVSAYTNTMQGKGYSQEQILHNLEDLADDLGLYHKAFSNQGKAITDQVDVLKRNGQWLNQEQQDQLVAYRKFNQEMDILNDSQKLAFFEGFMESLDPATVKEFKEAMQDALPFFKGIGRAAGDAAVGLLKLTNWITGKLNLLNGDNTSKEAVSQHYGTTSAPAQHGSNPVANAYGASQPKADGHEHNVFDTMREWWNGTSDAKDVSSYAQSTNGDYSPVSMLKQSAAAPAKPASAPIMQPVVLQNQLPEGLIHLTISPDPTFGNMLNATVDQRISDNNQRMVLAVSSGQGTGG